MKIILATNNQGKVNELKSKLNREVFSLKDLNIDIEIIEDGNTLEENAMIKAKAIAQLFPNDIVLADDTGLFVEALDFAPGVHSARYAYDGCSDEDNIKKLLQELAGKTNRNAYFETVVVVYKDQQYYSYSGQLFGEIVDSGIGEGGFGYDKVFYYPELKKTLAQLTKAEKNMISHRAMAINKVVASEVLLEK